MKFKKEDLQELIDCDFDGYVKVSDRITSNSRWSIRHEMIFSHSGSFYITNYSVGATEMQDESPYEYSPEEIECDEVVPVEKTITVYERKQVDAV